MTSPPPPSPAGGDDDRRPGGSESDDTAAPARAGGQPNYLVRRAIAVGVVVVVLAGGSVLAGRLIGSGSDDDGGEPVGVGWNSVVVVADDEVRVVDPDDGEVTATYPADEPLLDAESLVAGHTLVTMNDFGRITELDLRDGTIRRTTAADGSTLVQSEHHAAIVLAGPPIGGDVTVVDTADGISFDIGDVADLIDPLMFVDAVFVDESGRHVATADARSFQSLLVDIDSRTPFPLPGQVVALDDDTVVTAQRAGDRAELEFYDHQGERRGSADGPSPRATMLTSPTTAIVVSATGTIAAVGANGDVDEVGVLTPSSEGGTIEVRDGIPASGADRLVLRTDAGVVLLDADGTELGRAGGELLTPLTRASRCAVVGSERTTGVAVHVDLDTGEVLGEFPGGIVASASADGCTISMLGADARIVVDGVEQDLGVTRGAVTIAPDGESFVVTTPTTERLVRLETGDEEEERDDPPDPIVLAREPVLIHFAEL